LKFNKKENKSNSKKDKKKNIKQIKFSISTKNETNCF
jgi:hypothetical protein